MPSPEALQLATDAIHRRYLLPETMQHPVVKSECISLAYFIQAYGLCLQGSAPHDQDINNLGIQRSSERVVLDQVSRAIFAEHCSTFSGR